MAAPHAGSDTSAAQPAADAGKRLLVLSIACLFIGAVMALAAGAILWLITAITNLAFYGRFSFHPATPVGNHLGLWVILIPAIGGAIVALLARFGSRAIQGHGIPEAMEQVLLNGSRIPTKILALKPLSTCVVIGTGGPFGAEGVVIATGGALGSLVGQRFPVTPIERKTLLAAGAAAGLSACFSCPISAVLLAVELLLFEFHPRSLIPVALASAAAAACRVPILGPGPMFNVAGMHAAGASSLGGYLILGAVTGVLAVGVVRAVHWLEHMFEHLPIHWMWKPVLGGLGIGLLGFFEPHVLGPGYGDIETVLGGALSTGGVAKLGFLKLAAWGIGVGSATSSGTLAPLLLIGSSIGQLMAHFLGALLDPRVAALAGMAAFFGGMSGAFLASIVLAFEATYEPNVLMPLLAASAAAYLVCRMLSRENIMTGKFHRQGIAVPEGFTANPLDWVHVSEAMTEPAFVLPSDQTIEETAKRLAASDLRSDAPLPAADASGKFIGWVRLAELDRKLELQKPLADIVEATGAVVDEASTLREAARRMIQQEVDRLAVLAYDEPGKLVGVITQRDVLAAYRHEEDGLDAPRAVKLRFLGQA